MRRLMFGFALWIACALGAAAQDRGAIAGTINGQFDAFRAEDVDRAFSFASPNIQGIFRTPENFGATVRGGYPMVWQPGEVQFLELREEAGRLWQMVQVTDAGGAIHYLGYQMIETPDGWRINAVRVMDPPGAAV
jgi:hypothetical protein